MVTVLVNIILGQLRIQMQNISDNLIFGPPFVPNVKRPNLFEDNVFTIYISILNYIRSLVAIY